MLKRYMSFLVILSLFTACSSNPNKAEKLETEVEGAEEISAGRTMGKNDDNELITMRKVKLADYVRNLEKEVYELESDLYGDDYGNKGKWGVLESCLTEENSAELGGEGTYVKMPEKAVLTDREDKFQKIGYDEKKQLVAISTDYLKERIRRFENYKATYKKRRDWYETQIKICQANVKRKQHQARTAPLVEPPLQNLDVQLDSFVCQSVKTGARLKDLLKMAVAKGWVNKEDYSPSYMVNDLTEVDLNGNTRQNVLRLEGWSLSYDAAIGYDELMASTSSPKLIAWMHAEADLVPNNKKCLKGQSQIWTNQ